MTDSSPNDIFNDFKNGKVDSSTTVEKLLSISRDSRDENLRILTSEILLEMYRAAKAHESEESEHLKTLMEQIIGKKFISKYNIIPNEAIALGLVELIMRVELENEDEISNIHHVHAAFRIKDNHVIELDIAEMGCPKVKFLDLLPNLEYLRISMAGLVELRGLGELSRLKYLDLAANNLTKVKGLENLTNLEKLDLNLNKFNELRFFNSMGKLEELLLSFNPLEKLEGVDKLKSLKYIELEETNLPKSKIKQIKNIIKRE